MNTYTDIVLSEKAVAVAKQNGYGTVLCNEVAFIVPKRPGDIRPVSGKVNVVVGGDEKINQAAVRTKGVDVLLNPVNESEHAFDTATARVAKENGVTIAFSFGTILRTKGVQRVKLLKNFSFAIAIAKKMKANVAIFSMAEDEWTSRSPVDMAAMMKVLGLTEAEALSTIKCDLK